MSPNELKALLRSWCDAVERPPARPVEELGPEKRVEFDVRPKPNNGTAPDPPAMLPRVPGLVDKICTLLKLSNVTRQEHENLPGALTVYSGNGSMVVFAEWRLIITTPQRVHIVRYLLRILSLLYEAGYETEWASFVRKNNDSPWVAKDQQIAREFSVLKTIFPTGRSYIFGAVNEDHYFYYIYDDVKRDATPQQKEQQLREGGPERGRHGIEDNVQFNLKMYGITITGQESSLERFGLKGLSLEPPARNTEGNLVGSDYHRDGSHSDVGGHTTGTNSPNGTPPSVSPAGHQRLPGAAAGASMAPPIGATFPAVVPAGGVQKELLPRNESTNAADESVQAQHNCGATQSEDDSVSATPIQSPSAPLPVSIDAAKISAAEKPASPPAALRPKRGADELAVEVITQASRFVLPDQYETIRLLRDIKSTSHHNPVSSPLQSEPASPTSPVAGGGTPVAAAPRYVATYETTIDALDETRKSLTTMVTEFQPERFTIIALCDPFSPAAAALKQRRPIGLEPSLYPGYALINRTMNRFAWGYQVLQFTFAKQSAPVVPVPVVQVTAAAAGAAAAPTN